MIDRDTIVFMAREAGFETGVAGIGVPTKRTGISGATDAPWMLDAMTKFASLVAAAEREACAEILDRNTQVCTSNSMLRDVLEGNAAAIRARSNT